MKINSKKTFVLIVTTLFFFSLFSFSSSTFADYEKISADLAAKIKAGPSSVIPVIVQTRQGIQERHKTRVEQDGGKLKDELALIKGFAADLPAPAIQELARDEDIVRISYDAEVHTCLDTAVPAVNAPAAWKAGFTGKGIAIAVIDTGIYPHPDLTQPDNRIIAFVDFVHNRKLPYDDFGHGTHVAGIIAGNGRMSGGQYRGVAPEADLVGVKVLNSKGTGSFSTVIKGIEWVVRHKDAYGIRIINMSIGAPATESYTTDPLSQAAEAAYKAGLVVVTAAGNAYPPEGTIATPGINPNVITVGAVDDLGTVDQSDDVVAFFSSQGPTIDGLTKPDLVAPGWEITSLMADVSYFPKNQYGWAGKPLKVAAAGDFKQAALQVAPAYYFTASGTSMATPMVAGIAALLLEESPDWTPDQMKQYLMDTAVDLGFTPNQQGAGEVRYSEPV